MTTVLFLHWERFLTPQMKLSTLAYCYSKLDASTCEGKLQHVKSELYMLFDKYSGESNYSGGVQRTTQDQSSSMPLPKSSSHSLYDELNMHYQQLVTESTKSQLEIYLDESNLDFGYHEDMDVLQWWKSNNDRFPDLSILACDLLSVSIATIASTRDFCMGYHVFNKYKHRMLPMNMDARLCTRSWLYNFVSHDREDDDDDFEVME
ncbi:zinc finger BED domain-containing protein DAYSLEEPER-like [Trifolium pratense]|uniref:zinc finger BED domain-containing protein DAYSLEEPER-like n=1 Tax=Trifolium pratense TaxID=57577 RepID=UPI001E69587B|nr:zinc finger BED domain-containing protein DAYSLEEPER-like [Trifolium pratense]